MMLDERRVLARDQKRLLHHSLKLFVVFISVFLVSTLRKPAGGVSGSCHLENSGNSIRVAEKGIQICVGYG